MTELPQDAKPWIGASPIPSLLGNRLEEYSWRNRITRTSDGTLARALAAVAARLLNLSREALSWRRKDHRSQNGLSRYRLTSG
jgi:hypothetical protein